MSFPLPPEFERAVLDRVRSGRYASVEDVLAAMVDAIAERDTAEEELRNGLDKGRLELERGEAVTGAEGRDLFRAGFADSDGGDERFQQAMHAIRQRCGVPLGVEYREFVDGQVRSGQYASPTEVVEAALWQLHDAEFPETDDAVQALRREIDLGIESGDREELIPAEQVKARIRAKMRGGAR